MNAHLTTGITIGDGAPGFSLRSATDQKMYSLDSFKNCDLLVVIFLANHCPYVGSWEDRMIALAKEFAKQGVAFVAISSSDVRNFPQDGPEAMQSRAEEFGYPFPYLHDAEQLAAKSFGAKRTPEVFVFDRERCLQYHGAIDSDYEESPENVPYLRDAITGLLAGQGVTLASTSPIGCTIKFT
ncbi:MAG: thioredoxin family protein [Chloroflexota bacterium]